MNLLLKICNYNHKYSSSNSSLQNLHLIFMNLLLNISVLFNKIYIAKFTWNVGFMSLLLKIWNYNCKHCSSNSSLQNLHLILWIRYIFMNEFAFKYKYNCKYCSTKSFLQNLHENGVTSLWMNLLLNINIIVSIV
jgi:hypothetical protein